MDFIDRIREVATRVAKQQEYCLTEVATKNAMVRPFIHAPGYDIFNSAEVVPAFRPISVPRKAKSSVSSGNQKQANQIFLAGKS